MAKSVELIDTDTGEVLSGKLRIASKPKTVAPFREYAMMNLAPSADCSFLKSACDLRLLEKLRHIVGYDNALQINQTFLAKELDISRSQVCRSLKSLIDFGIVEKVTTAGGTTVYRLSPTDMWRGKAVNQRKAVAERKVK